MLCLLENKALDRKKTLTEIWGEDGYFTFSRMNVYITKLKKYLQIAPSIEIENIRGNSFILKIKE